VSRPADGDIADVADARAADVADVAATNTVDADQAGPDLAAYAAEHGLVHVTGHADVVAVSTDPATFCSAQGVLVTDPPRSPDAGPPPTLLHSDPPQHTRYRRLVQPAFGPGVVRALEPAIRGRVRALLDAIDAVHTDEPAHFDAVADLALPLPLAVIADLLGVDGSPESLARFAAWSDASVPGATDWPEEKRRALMGECFGYLVGVAKSRREAADSSDSFDIITRLATATVDGERLSDAELAMFLVQLLVAGNETTRHSISGGLLALAERPEQWAMLRADRSLVPSAVEEILRWTAPVRHFLRTATVDTAVAGCPVASGRKVLLDYRAAGFESGSDPDPGSFDVTRPDNPHLAFGFGPHFCLGAPLARLELRVVLEEVLDRFAALDVAGPPSWNGSPVVYGLRTLPLRAVPAQRASSTL
jgi:cytochrome P450